MKKAVNNFLSVATAVVMVVAIIMMAGTIKDMVSYEKTSPKQTKNYSAYGRYIGSALWVDDRGQQWEYSTETVSDIEVYEDMPVILCFNDNGTPDNIYDDKVIGILYDRETAIYDDLEDSLSETFELERDGNNIKLESIKNKEDK